MGPPDTWHGMAKFLQQVASTLPTKPKAIVIISGHWEEAEVTINAAAHPSLLYDYYGFPKETYELKYDAPGSPELAEQVHELLAQAGIPSRFDKQRGLDHGVFVPLKLVYPAADIPIVQVSLVRGLDPAQHIELGRALAPLRKQGVLIVGSGMSYHNLGKFGDPSALKGSVEFDDWLDDSIRESDVERRNQRLIEWEKAPSARAAHPTEEHLIPLMVAAGAGGTDEGKRIYSEPVAGSAISAFQFG